MNYAFTLLVAAALLSACGSAAPWGPAPLLSRVSDAGALGGLSDDRAAHPSVQLGQPAAFTLNSQARPFLQALSRVMTPVRRTLAERLAADPTVASGLKNWDGATADGRLVLFERITALEAEVMGCQAPSIIGRAGRSPDEGIRAFFQPDGGLGEVVIYMETIARDGKYAALAMIVHEVRHAAQHQLATAPLPGLAIQDDDRRTLTAGYVASWRSLGANDGETALAYGDYAHLNVEYDAFQTGNAVAYVVSGGSYDPLGFGFVDTHYGAADTPAFNLLTIGETLADVALVTAVNKAEFAAEQGRNVRPAPTRNSRRIR